ncbi:Aste57867_16927 [Aphanomyces stellatus]|uniref:Aste57867_16927 protein n=1 Tax=Aphanomyces stellatus TaxID=120398 RepID=A0A485L8G0_9STRA|nr:hypothetical protein As57867_016869 [Aphanomyces stellatus]VFT93689.1 Aste57867_16927 [Aphanomyces stellatus]
MAAPNRPPWGRPPPPRSRPPFGFHAPPPYYMFHHMPPLPPPDPDPAWVAQFSAQHLPPSPGTKVDLSAPPRTTMRAVRESLVGALQIVRECKYLQDDLNQLASTYAHAATNDLHTRTRCKLQYDRRREVLATKLASLRAHDAAFFGDKEILHRTTAMAKRVHRKKLYRRKVKQRTHAERRIRDGIQGPSDDAATTTARAHAQEAMATTAHRRLDDARQLTCAKVDLLLQLKAARGAAPNEDDVVARAFIARHHRRRQAAVETPLPSVDEATPTSLPSRPRVTSILHADEMTMESLVALRWAWDAYLVNRGGTRIPPHFVDPPVAPTPAWAVFARQPHST